MELSIFILRTLLKVFCNVYLDFHCSLKKQGKFTHITAIWGENGPRLNHFNIIF